MRVRQGARRRTHIASYYVQGADGRFYGPADMQTLNQWASEGRILADTVLVDAATNKQSAARDTPGLEHHYQLAPKKAQLPPQPPQPPSVWSNPPGPASQPYRAPGPVYPQERRSKASAALLALFFGCLGVHRFYLGYTAIGVVIVLITVVGTCCTGSVIGLVAGIVWGVVDLVLILLDALPDAKGLRLQ